MTYRTLRRAQSLYWVLGSVLILAVSVALTGLLRPTVAGGAPPVQADPTKVMGVKACLDCHKPEVMAWQVSRHNVNFDKLGENPNAKKYAAALGISDANITREGMCVDCHGQRAQATAIKAVTGVSCESCHGASGGETGWFNPHSSYGAKGLTREQETPEHKMMRHEVIDKAGQVRPARVYAMAKNCFGCHAVPNEALVNKAGHKDGSANFELSSWVSGDIAHNLFIDQKVNAQAPSLWMAETGRKPAERKRMLYVLGKMADLEVSLRNLAAAKEDGAYSQAMANRAKAAAGNLDDIKEIVPELVPVADAFKKIKLKLKPEQKDALLEVADKVAAAAGAVEKTHDGTKLKDLDDVLPKMGNGPRYDPTK